MKINFYNVDKRYIEFLKNFETQHRGFTCIPNIEYVNNDKFVYGIVLEIGDIKYYVRLTIVIAYIFSCVSLFAFFLTNQYNSSNSKTSKLCFGVSCIFFCFSHILILLFYILFVHTFLIRVKKRTCQYHIFDRCSFSMGIFYVFIVVI